MCALNPACLPRLSSHAPAPPSACPTEGALAAIPFEALPNAHYRMLCGVAPAPPAPPPLLYGSRSCACLASPAPSPPLPSALTGDGQWEFMAPAPSSCAQAGDGQWVFMDPLNLKCLLNHFGSYEACPPRITARVLEVESVEQVRDRPWRRGPGSLWCRWRAWSR